MYRGWGEGAEPGTAGAVGAVDRAAVLCAAGVRRKECRREKEEGGRSPGAGARTEGHAINMGAPPGHYRYNTGAGKGEPADFGSFGEGKGGRETTPHLACGKARLVRTLALAGARRLGWLGEGVRLAQAAAGRFKGAGAAGAGGCAARMTRLPERC